MISDFGAYVTIIVFAIIGILFAIYVYIQNNLGGDLSKELDNFLQQNERQFVNNIEQQSLNDQNQLNPGVSDSLKKYYEGITKQVHSCAIELFKHQTILMVFFALIFAVGFLIWLSSEDRAFLLMIAFGLGCTCVAINTLLTLQFSIQSVIKTAILPNTQSIFQFTFFNSSAISIATTAFSLLTLAILIPSYTSTLGEKENTVKDYTAIFTSILGFGLGTAYASLFYREAGGMSAKGILVGRDMISKSGYQNYDQTVIEVNLNTASIISNIYNNNIISVLDFQTVFTSFLCAYLIIMSQSIEVDTDFQGTFYMPMFIVGLNMLVAIGTTFIASTSPTQIEESQDPDYSIPKETAKQVRLQVLICNLFSFVFLICFPIFLVPEKFSIGTKELNAVSHTNIDPSDAIWSLMTGLSAQTLLIVYSEVFTSHYFTPVKRIAEVKNNHLKGGFSMTLLTATEYANLSQFGIFVLFGFTIMLGYLLSGLFGIACCIVGLLCAPFSLMSVNIFAGFTSEAFEISGIGYLRSMRQKLFSFSWASRNFSIYTQIVTIMAVLLTNILCIGACVFLTKEFDVYVWDAYGIFGFLYGGSLAYFIKGVGLSGIKNVAENIKRGYQGREQSRNDYKSNLKQVDSMVQNQYQTVILKVAINIFTSLLSIVLIGLFLGMKSLIAFILGMNLVGIYLCFMSLIVGYSVKNAREYNRNYGKVTDVDEAPIQADITVTACEGIPGTALVTYLVFNTLFVLQGSAKWATYGFFRKWVDAGELNKLADSTTDSYLSSLKDIPDIIKQAFDGEDGFEQ